MFRNICWAFSGDNGLSEEKVDYMMEKGLSAQEQVATHQLPDLKKSQEDNIRASRIAWLNDEGVFECIRPFVHSANSEAGWRLDLRQIELVQFTKYGLNQHYNWHIDGQCDHYASKVLSDHQDYASQGQIMPCLLYTSPSPRDRQ